MKTINITDRYNGNILDSVSVADDDPRPMRTALERSIMRGRPADQLSELRDDTEAEIEHADDIERQLLEYRIQSIDNEIANPTPDANLARANLESANLARANLARANLESANLARANLARANLESAYLESANLARANLESAYLESANLARAYLARAINLPSGIAAVDPPEPYALIAAQSLAEHAARFRARHPEVPYVENLDVKIFESVTSGGGSLQMAAWHTCDTTHCRGGWAIHHAGAPGRELELREGSERAAALIYMASTGRAPHFFATDEDAMADIKACAEAQLAASQGSSK